MAHLIADSDDAKHHPDWRKKFQQRTSGHQQKCRSRLAHQKDVSFWEMNNKCFNYQMAQLIEKLQDVFSE